MPEANVRGPPALREAYQRVEFYRLVPTRLVLIDNSRGFGHKDTLELGENSTKAARGLAMRSSRESTSKTHSGIALPNSTLTHIALGVGPIMNGLPRT